MDLTVNARRVDDVVILDLVGRLTLGEPVLRLREIVRTHANDGARKFILNLEGVPYIDSSGLGELLTSYATVKNRGGGLKLLKPEARTAQMIQLTRLDGVIPVFHDERAAVDALQPPGR
jgi:anti-sigma B factor antagonist